MGLLVVLPATSPLSAQAAASRQGGTHARKGLTIGAITGGVLGFVSFGLLGLGLCESSNCNADAAQFGLLGGVLGAAGGGLTGLVIGAAIPRRPDAVPDPVEGGAVADSTTGAEGMAAPAEGPAEGPGDEESGAASRWWPVLSVGASAGIGRDFDGGALSASASLLRATTSQVWWGVEVGHLGRRSGQSSYTVTGGAEPPVTYATAWAHSLWSASMVALRWVGEGPARRGYLLASVGAYPYRRTVRQTPNPAAPGADAPSVDDASYPGFSIGSGAAWGNSARRTLGLEARLHLPLGVGDGLSPLATLGGTLRFRR